MEIVIILIIAGVMIAGEALLYSKRGGKHLIYTAFLEKNEVFEGDEVTFTEEISNEKNLPLPLLKTEIVTPSALDFGVNAESSKEGLCYIPSVFSLRAREKCRRVRKIKCVRRGVFQVGASSLYGGDLFGLGGFTLPASVSEKLTVLPSPLSADEISPSQRLLYGDALTRRFICEDPFLVSGAHEYTGSEPMNSIFWNGSAKAGRLLAIKRDHTTSARILIALSFQRRDDAIAAAADNICETLIKAAAFALEQAEKLGAEYALTINLPDEKKPPLGIGKEFYLDQLRRLAKAEIICKNTNSNFLNEIDDEDYTDVIFICPVFSRKTEENLKRFYEKGAGICALTIQDETGGEFSRTVCRGKDNANEQ